MKDPFLAQLAEQGASFSNFRALIHPSYPNYLAMVGGSMFGVRSNDQITLPDDNNHRAIADLLDWKNYAEDYPSEPQPFLGDRGKYSRKHVPFLSFAKIQQESSGNVVSVSTKNPHNRFVADVEAFRRDPKKHPLPRYRFYSPNVDDDGHDPVLFPGTGLRKASTWLNKFLRESFPLDENHLRICRLLARGFDRWDTAVYGHRIVRHALGGRRHYVAEVARTTRTRRQLADGKVDG